MKVTVPTKTSFWVAGFIPVWLLLVLLHLLPGSDTLAEEGTQGEPAVDAVPSTIPLIQEVVEEGVRVTLEIRPLDGKDQLVVGEDARLSLTLRDENSGEAITGLHPLSWIHRREGKFKPNDVQIDKMIGRFLGGLLSVRADIDLNKYYLLVMNQDRTISVIDPQVNFSITKLMNLLALPGRGGDWIIDEIREKLFVTIPEKGQVVAIDLARMVVEKEISLGTNSLPVNLLLTADNSGLWVGLDGASGVALIDPEELVVKTVVPSGLGSHRLAVDSVSDFLCVTNSKSGTASIIDLNSTLPVREVAIGQDALSVAYCPAADLFYAASMRGETVFAIDASDGDVVAKIPAPRGIVDLEVEPGGRFLFLVSTVADTVSVIDTATQSVLASSSAVYSPDQISFSGGFAYIHNTERANVTLINLERIYGGELVVTELGIGRLANTSAPKALSIADMIVSTPEGNAVMVANPADKLIYYYVEGMMASMGNFQTYKRTPDGVLVLDRSLRESSPGVYSTYIRPTRAGIHDMPFVLDQPRIKHGFEVDVFPREGVVQVPAASPVALRDLDADRRIRPGEKRDLKFQLIDTSTKKPVIGLADVQVMVVLMPGIWQERHHATEVEPGIYQITQEFIERGRYGMLVSCPSRGASFNDLEMIRISVYPDAHGRRGPR